MKRIFAAVFLLLAISAVSFAQERNTVQVQVIDGSGNVRYVTPSFPMPVTFSSTATITTSIVLPSGILGTATLSIPLASSVALPTAPTGATRCFIMPSQDVNWGSTTVGSGTGYQYFFADIPGQGFTTGYTSFTGFRLIGRTAVATATILWY